MENNFFISLMKLVAAVFLICFAMYGCMQGLDAGYARQEKYAAEHNCRWDYNDMCYTIEERPWLF